MAFTPKAWTDGAVPLGKLNAAAMIDLETRLSAYTDAKITYGLDASRPSASSQGQGALYKGTDTDIIYISNGTSWVTYTWDSDFTLMFNGGLIYRETVPRRVVNSSAIVAAPSGQMIFSSVPLIAGDVITNMGARWGTTSATSPTHWWLALYDSSSTTAPNLIGQTADQTTTAITSSTGTPMIPLVGGPYTITSTGLYYAAYMCVASVMNTFTGGAHGSNMSGVPFTGMRRMVATDTTHTGLTTTAPAIAALASYASDNGVPYMILG